MSPSGQSVRRIRNAVSEDIDAAIEKALDKTPADRFDSTERFIQALTGERPVQSSTRSSQRVGRNRWVVGAPAALAVGVALWFGFGLGDRIFGGGASVEPVSLVLGAAKAWHNRCSETYCDTMIH